MEPSSSSSSTTTTTTSTMESSTTTNTTTTSTTNTTTTSTTTTTASSILLQSLQESLQPTQESIQPPQPQTPRSLNLFDYTEEELYCSHTNSNTNTNDSSHSSNKNQNTSSNNKLKFNHYELLQIPTHATSHDIKKAYRKLSLLYHPDKTGRDENDYVFLAIKNAYDTLMDPIKRNGYDSTVLTFDDSIPPSRTTLLLQQSQSTISNTTQSSLYTDDDFYTLYGPVFTRNLRFDAKLRPELQSSNQNNSNSINNSSHHKQQRHQPPATPPTLGDATTPISQVYEFYDYWNTFTSWRDFSYQAAQELQLSDIQDQVESRYEKRYYQKEIDKRTKQLKRQEMIRIQTLVERAMEADPRLRKERQEQLLAKERIVEEKRLEKIRMEQERIRQEEERVQQEEQMKIQKQQEKIQREQYKKLLRKSKQSVRKIVTAALEMEISLRQQQEELVVETIDSDNNQPPPPSPLLWKDTYDLHQDIDYLCTRLTLEEINILITNLNEFGNPNDNDNTDNNDEYSGSHALILEFVHQHVQEQKVKEQQELSDATATKNSSHGNNDNANSNSNNTTTTNNVWSTMELSTLIKAMKKYPMGGAGRWDAICNMINHTCTQPIPRTRQECIDKYNRILKQQQHNKNNSTITTTTSTNGGTTAVVKPPPPTMTTTAATSNDTTKVKEENGNGTMTNGTNPVTTSSSPSQITNDTNIANGTNDHGNTSVSTPTTTTNTTNDIDVWSMEQDRLLQEALLLYPATMEKNERWSLIASHIPNKNKKACVQRFKTIRQEIISSTSSSSQPSTSTST